jgi:hypothetical protein
MKTAKDKDKQSMGKAMRFLEQQLADGPKPSRLVIEEGRKAGISTQTIRIAVARRGVLRWSEGGGLVSGQVMYELPSN